MSGWAWRWQSGPELWGRVSCRSRMWCRFRSRTTHCHRTKHASLWKYKKQIHFNDYCSYSLDSSIFSLRKWDYLWWHALTEWRGCGKKSPISPHLVTRWLTWNQRLPLPHWTFSWTSDSTTSNHLSPYLPLPLDSFWTSDLTTWNHTPTPPHFSPEENPWYF